MIRKFLLTLVLGTSVLGAFEWSWAHEPSDPSNRVRPQQIRHPHDAPPRPASPDNTHRMDRHNRPMHELSPEAIDHAIEIIKLMHPDMHERLDHAQQHNPVRLKQMIQRRPIVQHLVELRRIDPEMFELRIREIQLKHITEQLAEQYRHKAKQGQEQEAQDLQNQLKEMVAEHFEVRQELRAQKVHRIERELAQLGGEIQQRSQKRNELIQKRVDKLVGETQEPTW